MLSAEIDSWHDAKTRGVILQSFQKALSSESLAGRVDAKEKCAPPEEEPARWRRDDEEDDEELSHIVPTTPDSFHIIIFRMVRYLSM